MPFNIANKVRLPSLLCVLLMLFASKSAAQFQVAAYPHGPGYEAIRDHNVTEALASTPPSGRYLQEKYVVSANRCLAEMMADRLDQALQTCSRAIELAPVSSLSFVSLRSRRRVLALLYSNRGVIHAISGNYNLAMAEFDKASKANPDFLPAQRNREYLSKHFLEPSRPLMSAASGQDRSDDAS